MTTEGPHSGVTPGTGDRVPSRLRPSSPHLDPVQQVTAAVDGSGEAPGAGQLRGLRRPRSEALLLWRLRLGRRSDGVGVRRGRRGDRAPQRPCQLHPERQPQPQPQPEATDPAGAELRQPGALVSPAPPAAPAPRGRGPGRYSRQETVHGVSREPAASELAQAGLAADALGKKGRGRPGRGKEGRGGDCAQTLAVDARWPERRSHRALPPFLFFSLPCLLIFLIFLLRPLLPVYLLSDQESPQRSLPSSCRLGSSLHTCTISAHTFLIKLDTLFHWTGSF